MPTKVTSWFELITPDIMGELDITAFATGNVSKVSFWRKPENGQWILLLT